MTNNNRHQLLGKTLMAKTPEAKVKEKVVAKLKELKAYYFFPATGGYGKSGVPDIVCCLGGKFVGIECKAGNNKTTKLQDKNLNQIGEAGGVALVVNEANMDDAFTYLSGIGLVWIAPEPFNPTAYEYPEA